MVPCECGKQFNDLTDWKSHSYVTGHCCIYKCRKLSSAASIRGFALKSGTSTFITHRYSDRNVTAPSKTLSNERHYPPPYDVWKGLAYSNLDPTESCYPLLGTWNAPAASILHPPKGWPQLPDASQVPTPFTMHPAGVCSPFPDAVWKIPESTRQPNLAYQSPDGTIWPTPVPLTKFQTAAHYHSLNSRPALILMAIPHSVVTPCTKSAASPTPMPRQMPPSRDSSSRPTTSSAPGTPEAPTAEFL